jgi:hypothetical protein
VIAKRRARIFEELDCYLLSSTLNGSGTGPVEIFDSPHVFRYVRDDGLEIWDRAGKLAYPEKLAGPLERRLVCLGAPNCLSSGFNLGDEIGFQ